MDPTFVALDLETTGLNAERDAIIELAAVRFSIGQVEDEFHSVVRPEVEVPFRVRQLTGIDAEALEDAPPVDVVLPALVAFVGQRPVVGHSVDHDLAFLNRYGVLLEQPTIDTFELACILVPEATRYGLADLTALLGLAVEGEPHRALPDAHVHRRLFEALVERARGLGPQRLAVINRLASQVTWPLAPVFERAAAEATTPELPTPRPAPSERRLRPAAQPQGVDAGGLERLISPDGPLAAQLPGFEDRPAQRQMLCQCCTAFNDGAQMLIEAGTGTGKSLAYLIPAAAWSEANGRPVVVATHTLNLQDQLLNKDFPVAERLLGLPVRAAVLKGRSNYLCRSRLAKLLERDDLDLHAVRAIAKIMAWEGKTENGDRSGLMLQPDEQSAWRLVSADRDSCAPERCAHARAGECWLQRARAEAEAANVVVVNHALLISDMVVENRLLPHYEHLIIDEGHHLEEVATRTLGVELGFGRIAEALATLTAGGGTLASLSVAVSGSDLPPEPRARFAAVLAEAERSARRMAPACTGLFAQLAEYASQNGTGARTTLRLTPTARASPAWMQVELAWDTASRLLGGLQEQLGRLQQGVLAVADELPDADSVLAGLNDGLREWGEIADGFRRTLERPSRQDVCWIGLSDGRATLSAAPLYVGDTLAQKLFAGLQTLVLTSATLRANDSFDFLRERLSLPEADGELLPSPFDFAANALLFVPADMPEPDHPDYQHALDGALAALALAVGGRTLVLYTSHRALRRTYREVSGPLGRQGILVLGQGIDGGRDKLLGRFREAEVPTVLLGTRSFWEGIDVPGPALSALVIARLPFDVPTDPVFEARSEMFDDPFAEYSLPLAVLRFRQGFGRLIRSRADRGIVAILDSRIGRYYGRSFLDALPPCQRYYGSVRLLADVAARFLAGDLAQALAAPEAQASFGNEPGTGR